MHACTPPELQCRHARHRRGAVWAGIYDRLLASVGGRVEGLALPQRVFPCATPAEVRATLPEGVDVLAFQCRNPIHRAHYELFTRALDAPNVGPGAVCLVHPTCGPTQVHFSACIMLLWLTTFMQPCLECQRPGEMEASLTVEGVPHGQHCQHTRIGSVQLSVKVSLCAHAPRCDCCLQDDDIPGITRYHTYEVLKEEVANPRLRWAYLPYSMHMAGPREAIQHMIIRKNYGCCPHITLVSPITMLLSVLHWRRVCGTPRMQMLPKMTCLRSCTLTGHCGRSMRLNGRRGMAGCTHFIIGRDMAGCKSSLTGEDFYGPYDAQDIAKTHAAELGVDTVPSLNITYTQVRCSCVTTFMPWDDAHARPCACGARPCACVAQQPQHLHCSTSVWCMGCRRRAM